MMAKCGDERRKRRQKVKEAVDGKLRGFFGLGIWDRLQSTLHVKSTVPSSSRREYVSQFSFPTSLVTGHYPRTAHYRYRYPLPADTVPVPYRYPIPDTDLSVNHEKAAFILSQQQTAAHHVEQKQNSMRDRRKNKPDALLISLCANYVCVFNFDP